DPDEQADDRGEAPLSHGADALYEADDAYDPLDDYETYAPQAPEAAGPPLQAQTAGAQELSAAARAEEESAGDDVARAAEPAQPAGDADAERLRSALASVLDRLGSAHHRPFSRP